MLSLLFYLLYKGCKITREGLSLDDYENIKSKINTLKTTIENLFKGIKYNDPLGDPDPTNEGDDGQVTTIYNAINALTFSNIGNDDLKTIGNYLNEFHKEIQKCILFIDNKNQSGNDLHKSIITENNLILIKSYLDTNIIKEIKTKKNDVIEEFSCTAEQKCINKKFECVDFNSDGTDFCGKNDDGTCRELSELNCKKCNITSPQDAHCLECQDGYCLDGKTCKKYDGKNICNSGSAVCGQEVDNCRECATKTSDLIGGAATCLKCDEGKCEKPIVYIDAVSNEIKTGCNIPDETTGCPIRKNGEYYQCVNIEDQSKIDNNSPLKGCSKCKTATEGGEKPYVEEPWGRALNYDNYDTKQLGLCKECDTTLGFCKNPIEDGNGVKRCTLFDNNKYWRNDIGENCIEKKEGVEDYEKNSDDEYIIKSCKFGYIKTKETTEGDEVKCEKSTIFEKCVKDGPDENKYIPLTNGKCANCTKEYEHWSIEGGIQRSPTSQCSECAVGYTKYGDDETCYKDDYKCEEQNKDKCIKCKSDWKVNTDGVCEFVPKKYTGDNVVVQQPTKCKMKYVERDGVCYRFIKEKDTWQNQKKTCENDGTKLVIPKNTEMNQDIFQLCHADLCEYTDKGDKISANLCVEEKFNCDSPWIGAYSTYQIGKQPIWKWGNGLTMNHLNWDDNYPITGKNYNCVSLKNKKSDVFSWGNDDCSEKKPAICAYKLGEDAVIDDQEYYSSEIRDQICKLLKNCDLEKKEEIKAAAAVKNALSSLREGKVADENELTPEITEQVLSDLEITNKEKANVLFNKLIKQETDDFNEGEQLLTKLNTYLTNMENETPQSLKTPYKDIHHLMAEPGPRL